MFKRFRFLLRDLRDLRGGLHDDNQPRSTRSSRRDEKHLSRQVVELKLNLFCSIKE